MLTEALVDVDTAPAYAKMFGRGRHKGLSGGRGSGKSHFWADYLIEGAMLTHQRCVCLREVQNTIKDSVHQLLRDKIKQHNWESSFEVTESEIRGPHESLFIFRGLQTLTALRSGSQGMKSLEGYNRAWVEEAQTVSKGSMNLLIPTIRAPGSEILYSWNPRYSYDPVDRFFRENAGDNDVVHKRVYWWDNPWFPDDLRNDMERDRRRDPDKYAHVWLGEYEKSSEARVFRNWKIEEFETPADARYYFGADWGSIDPTVLVRCFFIGRTLYVDHEVYASNVDIDYLPAFFAGSDARIDHVDGKSLLAPRWPNPKYYAGIPGAHQWPITADSARPEIIGYMRKFGFNIQPARKGPGSVEEGIEFLKNYDIVVHPRCTHTSDELSKYSYKTDPHTLEVIPKLPDEENHVIDALRYATEAKRHAGIVVIPFIATRPRESPT